MLFIEVCFFLFDPNNLLDFEVEEFLFEVSLVLFAIFFFEVVFLVDEVFIFVNFFFFEVIVLDLVAAFEV